MYYNLITRLKQLIIFWLVLLLMFFINQVHLFSLDPLIDAIGSFQGLLIHSIYYCLKSGPEEILQIMMNRGQTVVPSQGLSTQWIDYNTNIKKSLYGPIDGKTQTRGCLVVICHSTSQLRFGGFFYNQMPLRAILKRVLTSFVFICYSRKKFFALRVSLLLLFFFFLMLLLITGRSYIYCCSDIIFHM